MSTRLNLHDSMVDVVMKMSEGNPGAVNVLMGMLTRGYQIDPEAAMGGLAPILLMDSLNIYGSRIYILVNDVCRRDLAKAIAILRGWQLGFLTEAQVRHAVDNYIDHGINVDEVCRKVQEFLPRFQFSTEVAP